MKKVLAFVAAVSVISGSAFAGGAVNLTTYDSGNPIFYLTSGSTANGSDFYAEVLGGASASTLAPIANAAGETKWQIFAGDFDGGFGNIPGVADNGTAFLQVKAWKGADLASAAFTAQSAVWSQTVGANPGAPTLPSPANLNIPSSLTIVAIPEPSTIALGMLGAAALLIRRRK